MSAFFSNVYGNVLSAWKFGNQNFQESKEWVSKKVEVIPLNANRSCLKRRSYSRSFFDVAQRLVDLVANSLLLFRYGSFDSAGKFLKMKEGKGFYKSFILIPTFEKNMVYITDPNLMLCVLRREKNETGPDALFLGGIPTEISRIILGDNLLSYPDQEHTLFRKQVSLSFMQTSKFHDILYRIIEQKLIVCHDTHPIVISHMLPSLVIESICRCFLNYVGPYQQITKSVEILLASLKKRESREYQDALNFLEESAKEVQNQEPKSALLQAVPEEKLRTFIKLMFFAGQDTTSAFVEYLVLILGQNAFISWQSILHEKWIASRQTLTDFALESTDLNCIIKEALRIYPPSFEQTRLVQQDLIIDDTYVISAGTEVHLQHFYSQRDSRRWGPDSETFNPLRHQNQDEKHPQAYPFSFGPTACLGRQFALSFVKTFLMVLISKYQWSSLSKIERLFGAIALKIEPPVTIMLKKRD